MLEQFFHKHVARPEHSGLESQPVGAWEPIMEHAAAIGADIHFSSDTVHIAYGRSHGDFPIVGGGASYALAFLKECAG